MCVTDHLQDQILVLNARKSALLPIDGTGITVHYHAPPPTTERVCYLGVAVNKSLAWDIYLARMKKKGKPEQARAHYNHKVSNNYSRLGL